MIHNRGRMLLPGYISPKLAHSIYLATQRG